MAWIDVMNKRGTGGNKPPSGFTSWLDSCDVIIDFLL